MDELKKCPFCGGEAYEREHAFKNAHSWSMIICDVCGASVQRAGLDGTYEGAKQAATEAWNTRYVETCEVVNHGSPMDGCVPLLQCKECEALFYGDARGDLPSYCPSCGRKVVGA